MITFFTIPKPFKNHIGIIQKNAINSWKQLGPDCEIILFGDDEGVAEAAKELSVKHVKNISHNEFGTPLLNDAFEKVQHYALNKLICYANCDIILLDDFYKAAKLVSRKKSHFLLTGRRWNIDITEPLYFNQGWEAKLKTYVNEHGKLYTRYGLDYFLFPKGQYSNFPPFAVGRPRWDNWMIYDSCSRRIPVIDATRTITVIHQNHDYKHIKNIENRFGEGPEEQQNLALAGGKKHLYTLDDSTHVLTGNLILPAIDNRVRKLWRIYLEYTNKI